MQLIWLLLLYNMIQCFLYSLFFHCTDRLLSTVSGVRADSSAIEKNTVVIEQEEMKLQRCLLGGLRYRGPDLVQYWSAKTVRLKADTDIKKQVFSDQTKLHNHLNSVFLLFCYLYCAFWNYMYSSIKCVLYCLMSPVPRLWFIHWNGLTYRYR